MALTNKQKKFISEYLVDLNATQAAIRAGYSPKSAYAIGVENLRKPQIAEAIEKAQEANRIRNETTIDLIDEMHKEAFMVAKENHQASAMTTAALNLSKLHGLIVDKSEITGADGSDLVPNVSAETLAKQTLLFLSQQAKVVENADRSGRVNG